MGRAGPAARALGHPVPAPPAWRERAEGASVAAVRLDLELAHGLAGAAALEALELGVLGGRERRGVRRDLGGHATLGAVGAARADLDRVAAGAQRHQRRVAAV